MRQISTVALAFALALPVASSATAQTPAAAPAAKKVVRGAADLPTYNYQLPAAPSELLTGPVERVLALADAVARDDARTTAEYDVADQDTREGIIGRRISAAILRRDAPAARAAAAELRSIQQRPDRKLTAGLMSEVVAEACASVDPQATAARLAGQRLRALPYAEVDTWLRQTRAGLSTANPDLILGSFKSQLDPVAAANGNKVNQGVAAGIVGARAALQCQLPLAASLEKAVGEVIAANASTAPAADIWQARDVVLTEKMRGRPVVIGVWDSGVDMSLFRAAGDPGFAVDDAGKEVPGLLRPAGPYQARTGALMDTIKGAMDLQAGLQTAEATAFQQTVRGMKPEQVKEFTDSLGFVGNYIHGTHVAGIAVAGNPFARVMTISNHWPYRQEDMKLTRAMSEGRAAFYQQAVDRMKRAGVRVVNMSWRFSPALFESILQLQGGMPDAAERRRVAGELYAIEKAAFERAIRSAPSILFVAAAGNEANDSNFADYLPAGLRAPNLITVGAVDKAGREALFTSTGGTVAVHANGVEVESFFPGGQRRALSGTSMASPQVANLAAKLVAMKPGLTGVELRALLVDTADQQGRVRLLDPKEAFAKAGVRL